MCSMFYSEVLSHLQRVKHWTRQDQKSYNILNLINISKYFVKYNMVILQVV